MSVFRPKRAFLKQVGKKVTQKLIHQLLFWEKVLVPLRIRHLEIRLTTSKGLFGVRIPFGDGLVVIHADNTSGKSTCLMSVL